MNDGNINVAVSPQSTSTNAFAATMPTALALYLNDALFERVSQIALRMSKADGITPKHLMGKSEACFAVVSLAITWRLDPFRVGAATYQTPGGQIGFEGKLVHAIIEASGKLDPASGGVRYEHYGDWSKVQGRFAIKESQKMDDNGKPKKYTAAIWTDDDARAGKPIDQTKWPMAQSCGVRVIAHIRGETLPRTLDFDLIQAQPRNSTLWATDPMTQICYTAVRRFASAVVPALMMGVPFDPVDNFPAATGPIDVTADGEVVERKGPQSKSEAAAAAATTTAAADGKAVHDVVDTETGEITMAAAKATTEQSAAAEPTQKPAEGQAPNGSPPAPTGMLNIIRAKAKAIGVDEARLLECHKLARLEGISVNEGNVILKSIASGADAYAK